MLQIRAAEKTEMEWVNQCYDQVQFIHSSFDREIIAIAELNYQKVGLGRLVTIETGHFELGGMYVLESFRGKGIARRIVDFLIQQVLPQQTVYCIPFEPLVPFYQQWGFIPCQDLEQVPRELLKKYGWCQKQYSQPTSLLILRKT